MNITNCIDSCVSGQQVFAIKNQEYGDTIEMTGVLGASVEIIGTAGRLRKLVLEDPGHGRDNVEALRNALTDVHNYAAIGIHMLNTGNWEGKSDE